MGQKEVVSIAEMEKKVTYVSRNILKENMISQDSPENNMSLAIEVISTYEEVMRLLAYLKKLAP